MRRSISRERQQPDRFYIDSRMAAVEAINQLDAASGDVGEVLALLADIPVRSRFVTLTCLKDGTVGIYYSSGESHPRIGRSGKRLPPAGKLLLSRLALIADGFSYVPEVESLEGSENVKNTCVYFKCCDGLRKVEYDMSRLDECDEDIRRLDTMLKDLLRMIRRSKERL